MLEPFLYSPFGVRPDVVRITILYVVEQTYQFIPTATICRLHISMYKGLLLKMHIKKTAHLGLRDELLLLISE